MPASNRMDSIRDVAKATMGRLRHRLPSATLPPAINAERHMIATADAGTISYYADTSGIGRPLLLLHGVHAAASSYEMRMLFDAFRGERPVYALDLPGFGFSQRGGMSYSVDTYVRAIEHMLRHVADEREEDRADLVASSLTCEYAVRAALELPDLVQSLTLLSPTGFSATLHRPTRRGKASGLWNALSRNAGELLFDVLVSKPSLAYYLRKSFEGPVDTRLLDYAYLTSHQPGAHHAPLAFIAGRLFPTGDPKQLYAQIQAPALVLYDQDPYTDFSALRSFVQRHLNYDAQRVVHTRGLPQIEAFYRTVRALRLFWERIEAEDAFRGVRHERSARRDTLPQTH